MNEILINKAIKFHQVGHFDQAKKIYLKILKSNKKDPNLLRLLGTLYVQIGDYNQALLTLNEALKYDPNNSNVFLNIGFVFQKKNHLDKAIENYDYAIKIKPDNIDAYNNKSIALRELNKLNESLDLSNYILKIAPQYFKAYLNKGIIYYKRKEYSFAITEFQKIIKIFPDTSEAYFYLGLIFNETNKRKEAVEYFDKAIDLNKDFLDAYYARAQILEKNKQLEHAIYDYVKVLKLNPNHIDAMNNAANIYSALGQKEKAISLYDNILNINQGYLEAYYNKGLALQDTKNYSEALKVFNKLKKLKPDFKFLLGRILTCKKNLCDWNDIERIIEEIKTAIKNKKLATEPFILFSSIDDPSLLQLSAQIYAEDKFLNKAKNPNFKKLKNKKIKIAYFSADFKNHAVLHQTLDIFKNHNRSKFDIYAISFGNISDNYWTNEVKKNVKEFYDVRFLSDDMVANLCKNLNIDICVDLTGYTSGSRTGILSYRAAQIQINYFGFSGTTSASFMDYIIADKFLITEDLKANYSEKIIYMPKCFFPNTKTRKISSKNYKHENFNLPKNKIIFANLNKPYKITYEVFEIWMSILKEVPNSILWLMESENTTMNNLKNEATKKGISENRIIFAPKIKVEDHLKRLELIDLVLDSFPYNGHVTTAEAIRMNVPVLTISGKTFASRVSGSILNSLNLKELITNNFNEYKQIAIDLGNSPKKLREIKLKMNDITKNSDFFNSLKFTQDLEKIYSDLAQ